jgi:anti-anti-sigma regulatory factor
MTKPLTPLRTLPAGRAQRRAPAGRPTVAPLVGDLETRPRELKADLVALLRPDTTLVLDLRDATFLGPAAARLLLDLCGQAAASGTRLILWRPNDQPHRTLRIAGLRPHRRPPPAVVSPRARTAPRPRRVSLPGPPTGQLRLERSVGSSAEQSRLGPRAVQALDADPGLGLEVLAGTFGLRAKLTVDDEAVAIAVQLLLDHPAVGPLPAIGGGLEWVNLR